MSSIFSINNVLPNPFPSNLGGNTNAYQSVGGKKTRKTKKGKGTGTKKEKRLKKKRVSRKKTKRFLFF